MGECIVHKVLIVIALFVACPVILAQQTLTTGINDAGEIIGTSSDGVSGVLLLALEGCFNLTQPIPGEYQSSWGIVGMDLDGQPTGVVQGHRYVTVFTVLGSAWMETTTSITKVK
jgi:hypothetical protein